MDWAHLNLEAGEWSMLPRGTKNEKPHVLPLPKLAVEIIAACPRVSDTFVFPSARDPAKPLTGFTALKEELDEHSGLRDWTFHDLRRTMSSHMARFKIPKSHINLILNHKTDTNDQVAQLDAVYIVYAYLDEMRAALERWAEHVEGVIIPVASAVPAPHRIRRYYRNELDALPPRKVGQAVSREDAVAAS